MMFMKHSLKSVKFMGPLVRCLGPRAGPIRPYNETYKLNMNLMRGYDIHEILYLNSEIMIHG